MSIARKAIVLGESPGDREAIALVGRSVAPGVVFDTQFSARSNSFSGVLKAIGPAIYQIKYRQVKADALLILVDADDRPVDPEKEQSRLAQVREAVSATTTRLSKDPTLPELRIAIGVAAPAIEAWLLHNKDGRCTEAECEKSVTPGNAAAWKRDLKKKLYGANAPPAVQHEKMVERMQELIEADQLGALARSFPHGFGTMLEALRSWV